MIPAQLAAALAVRHVPKFRIVSKSSSRLHRAISKLFSVTGSRIYIDEFWTTIGFTTASPTRRSENDWEVLLHEAVHAAQAKRFTRVGMAVAYLFPQIFGIATLLALPALILTGSWWGFLGLLFLAPLPAPGRAALEWEAYKVTLAIKVWRGAVPPVRSVDFVEYQFTGPNYYYMLPFSNWVRRKADKWCEEVRSGKAVLTPYLKEVRALVQRIQEEHAAG